MPNIISETQIENAIIDVFVNKLHYRHLKCEHADLTGRTNEREVIIRPILQNRLEQLNPGLPASAIAEAVDQLTATRHDRSALLANQEVYNLLRNGVSVEITNRAGKREPVTVRIIDFNDHDHTQNDYLVVSQLWIQGEVIRRRPDLIVYINGLPLIFIELKNSNVALRNAYDDNLTNYRRDIPLLFHANVICILSNGLETKVGSFLAGWEHFFNWLRPEDEKQVPDKQRIRDYGVSLDYAVLGLCEKNRLLDYVENFVFYYKDAVKIVAKNHQFLGVNNAIRNFRDRLDYDRIGTDITNRGKLGVFWHTQGSGKSYSIIFFARKVFHKFVGNYTFLIVTDREELDGQLYRNFLGAGTIRKKDSVRPKDSEDLRIMLGTNQRFIFTLIQKFRFDKGKQYPVLSHRNDIVVIVDEAHRTQYKDLADNMRAGLPKAQYMAFTGTPLLGSRKLTNDWFGGTVSEYNFKQSIEDGSTVPLFYHKRVPEVLLQNDSLDDDLADIVADENLTDEQQRKLEREFAQEISVLKADDRLETIAKDIVYHFPRRGYLGKGMVVTIDKFTAVRMYDKVWRLWKDEIKNLNEQIKNTNDKQEKIELTNLRSWMRKADIAVVISKEAGEEEKFEKQGLSVKLHRKRMVTPDDNGLDLEAKFKAPDDPLQLVFVCSMWLTGFDAPTVSTLYLDKPMKDHTLMQTIARANRVTEHLIDSKPKKNGLIVDYYNVFKNLKKAFASYGGGSLGSDDKVSGEDMPVQEKDHLYTLLQDAIDECDTFCQGLGIDLHKITDANQVFSKLGLFDQYADILLEGDDRKRQFVVYDNLIDALYEAARPEVLSRKRDFALKDVIHYLREVTDGRADRGNLDTAKRRISALIDESIVANDEFTAKGTSVTTEARFGIKAWKQIDLSKLDVNKLREEYKQATYKNIEIADLRAFITAKLQQLLDRNVTRTSFAQRLQEIVDRYNAGGSLTEDYFNDLVNFLEQLKEEESRHIREGLTEGELEIYDLLHKDSLSKDEEQKVKLAAKSLLKRLKEERPTVLINDWHKDTQTRLQVQAAIEKVLDDNLPTSYDRSTYKVKCDATFNHFYTLATQGSNRAMA